MKWSLLFVAVLLLLMAYSALEHDQRDPDMRYILDHIECYNNTMVTVSGEVVERTDAGVTVELSEPPYTTFFLSMPDSSTEPGDHVEAQGILNGTEALMAQDMMVTEGWKYSLIFLRSLPAIPLALYLFWRRWRFNRETWRFEVKDA